MYGRAFGFQGLSGGGLGEEDCAQPVSTAERDKLRDEIKGWTSPYKGQHYHEGHPDIKAVFIDAQNRLRGLEQRPKLLRCSKEARHRATTWISQLEGLRNKASRRGTTPGGLTTTWIRVDTPFQFTLYRGPTFTIRAGTPHPEAFTDLVGSSPTVPGGSTPTSAPPGSVVIDNTVYESSAAARAAAAAASSTATPTTGGPSPSFAGVDLGGEIAGIPTQYLVYGGLALLAFKMLGR